jgi:ankyrin repeat protein
MAAAPSAAPAMAARRHAAAPPVIGGSGTLALPPASEALAPAARTAEAQDQIAPPAPRARAPRTAPLLIAAAQGDAATVRRLLEQGADVNATDAQGRNALMLAAQRGDAALVRLLLDAGADAQRTDPAGLSAADHARRAGHPGLVPALNEAAEQKTPPASTR